MFNRGWRDTEQPQCQNGQTADFEWKSGGILGLGSSDSFADATKWQD
jgi:hypothetical protein